MSSTVIKCSTLCVCVKESSVPQFTQAYNGNNNAHLSVEFPISENGKSNNYFVVFSKNLSVGVQWYTRHWITIRYFTGPGPFLPPVK